jgi:hypothetical protein
VAASTKIRAFWDIKPSSLVGVVPHFRGAYCLHHQGDRSSISSLFISRKRLLFHIIMSYSTQTATALRPICLKTAECKDQRPRFKRRGTRGEGSEGSELLSQPSAIYRKSDTRNGGTKNEKYIHLTPLLPPRLSPTLPIP